MAKHIVKCLKCGKQFDANEVPYIKIGRRYAHESCSDSKEIKEEIEKDAFYQTVKKIYGSEYNYMLINTQCESFIATYGYTWSGMRACLHWFYEINHGSLEEGHGGVGIIPFIYDQVRDYYTKLYKTQEKNRNGELRQPVIEFNIQSPRSCQRPPQLLDLEEEINE